MLWGHSKKHQTLLNFLQTLQNLHSSFTSFSRWQILARFQPSFPCHALARALLSRSHLSEKRRERSAKKYASFSLTRVLTYLRALVVFCLNLRNVCEEMSKVKIFKALYSPTHTHTPSAAPRIHTWHILEQIDWIVCLLLTSNWDKALSYLLSCTDYVKQKCVKLFKRRLWITVNIGREIKSICCPKGQGRARWVKGSERPLTFGLFLGPFLVATADYFMPAAWETERCQPGVMFGCGPCIFW